MTCTSIIHPSSNMIQHLHHQPSASSINPRSSNIIYHLHHQPSASSIIHLHPSIIHLHHSGHPSTFDDIGELPNGWVTMILQGRRLFWPALESDLATFDRPCIPAQQELILDPGFEGEWITNGGAGDAVQFFRGVFYCQNQPLCLAKPRDGRSGITMQMPQATVPQPLFGHLDQTRIWWSSVPVELCTDVSFIEKWVRPQAQSSIIH